MKFNLLIGGIAALVPCVGLRAQEAPPPAAGLESREASIANLETHIAQREQRLAERATEIVELDSRVERRVDELVKLLSGLPDTGESAAGARQLKREVIQGLKSAVDAYTSKRGEVAGLAQAGDAAAEKDLEKFDERIARRVGEIADLTKSMPADPESKAYESEGGAFWNGYFYERSRLSGESGGSGRNPGDGAKQPEVAASTLRKSLGRIDERRNSLKELLGKPKVTAAARQLYSRELGRLAANADHLQLRLRDITVASLAAGKPVANDQPHDLTALIEDSRKDLREDFARLFICYDQLVRDRTYVEYLKAVQAAGKKKMEMNEPGKEPTSP
jgi:uncharacterized coiled-coil protein SlyX